jgi:hypothetical protein
VGAAPHDGSHLVPARALQGGLLRTAGPLQLPRRGWAPAAARRCGAAGRPQAAARLTHGLLPPCRRRRRPAHRAAACLQEGGGAPAAAGAGRGAAAGAGRWRGLPRVHRRAAGRGRGAGGGGWGRAGCVAAGAAAIALAPCCLQPGGARLQHASQHLWPSPARLLPPTLAPPASGTCSWRPGRPPAP